jgi:hypothetical protein
MLVLKYLKLVYQINKKLLLLRVRLLIMKKKKKTGIILITFFFVLVSYSNQKSGNLQLLQKKNLKIIRFQERRKQFTE